MITLVERIYINRIQYEKPSTQKKLLPNIGSSESSAPITTCILLEGSHIFCLRQRLPLRIGMVIGAPLSYCERSEGSEILLR